MKPDGKDRLLGHEGTESSTVHRVQGVPGRQTPEVGKQPSEQDMGDYRVKGGQVVRACCWSFNYVSLEADY